MIARLRAAAALIGVLGVAVVLDGLYRAIDFGLALRIWTVAAGGLLAAALAGAAAEGFDRTPVTALFARVRRPPEDDRPESLAEVERALEFSTWSAVEVERRLRPLLREVAAHRLRNRRGLDLDGDPEVLQELLGPELYSLTRPVQQPRAAGLPGRSPLREAGVSVAVLSAAVAALEEV